MATTPLRMAAVLIALVLSAGCDYYDVVDDRPYEWPVTIENQTRWTVDIYADGDYRATLTPDATSTLYGLLEGNHHLEAFDLDGYLIAERRVYLDRELYWRLE